MGALRTKQFSRMTFGSSGSSHDLAFEDNSYDDTGSTMVFGGIGGLKGRLARARSQGHWELVDVAGRASYADATLQHVPDDDYADVALGDETPLEIGAQGEHAAVAYLAHEGYEILETNWTCPAGEADIIALDGPECVFVEVKSRLDTPRTHALPELAVNADKQRRYQHIAAHYAMRHDVRTIRYDVIAVNIMANGMAKLRHYECAFGGDR